MFAHLTAKTFQQLNIEHECCFISLQQMCIAEVLPWTDLRMPTYPISSSVSFGSGELKRPCIDNEQGQFRIHFFRFIYSKQ